MKFKNVLAVATTAFIATSAIDNAASAAMVTYQQKKICSIIPSQAARTAGFIRVGNQSEVINVAAVDAYEHCSWGESTNARTVTHRVPTRWSDH